MKLSGFLGLFCSMLYSRGADRAASKDFTYRNPFHGRRTIGDVPKQTFRKESIHGLTWRVPEAVCKD